MIFRNFLQNIKDFRRPALQNRLCIFYVRGNPPHDELPKDKGFEHLERHFFGNTALGKIKLRSYDDDGPAGIIYTFTQEILTEPTLLATKHI